MAQNKPKKGGRGNPANLIPMNQRTHEEASEFGKKGGIASGKARNLKKDLKKCVEDALYGVKLNRQGINQLKRKGVQISDDEELNLMMGMVLGLAAESIKGSASASQALMDMSGIPRMTQEEGTHELVIKMDKETESYGD